MEDSTSEVAEPLSPITPLQQESVTSPDDNGEEGEWEVAPLEGEEEGELRTQILCTFARRWDARVRDFLVPLGEQVWTSNVRWREESEDDGVEDGELEEDHHQVSNLHTIEALVLTFLTYGFGQCDVALALRLAFPLSWTRDEQRFGPATGKWVGPSGSSGGHWCTEPSLLAVQRHTMNRGFREILKNAENPIVAMAFCGVKHCTPPPILPANQKAKAIKVMLQCAGLFGNLPLACYLAEVYKDDLVHALHGAAAGGHLDVVHKLITHCGVHPNAADNAGRTAFAFACRSGAIKVAHLLVSRHKADPFYVTVKGRTALHLAAKNGHEQLLQTLIDLKFDVDRADLYGTRPVHEACMHGHLECLKLLVDAKATLEHLDGRGNHPFHVAAHKGYFPICDYLLDHKVSVDVQSRNKGTTALHNACCVKGYPGAVCQLHTVRYLLAKGANPRLRSSVGDAFEITKQLNNHELLVVLTTFEQSKEKSTKEPETEQDEEGHTQQT